MFSEDRPVGNPAQIFRSFLKNKGLRNTPQRQQIMEVFFNESGHLTTEEIYDRVRKERSFPWPSHRLPDHEASVRGGAGP